MDLTEILVLAGGVLLIGAILWYFFGAREAVSVGVTEVGVQQIKITVKGGYSPDVIVVKEGTPVRLDFYRDETASCSEQVLFRDFALARDLSAFKTIVWADVLTLPTMQRQSAILINGIRYKQSPGLS